MAEIKGLFWETRSHILTFYKYLELSDCRFSHLLIGQGDKYGYEQNSAS
jgi:hypothetical protein